MSDFWVAATAAYGEMIERVPDSDFYRTFYNSVTRDLFGTVGVNPRGGVLRHPQRARLGLGADTGLPRRRLAAVRGHRRARRPAVRRRRWRPRTWPCAA